MDLTPKDVDLHTDATPEECVAVYNEAGVRFEPTGLQHGTISVIFDHVAYEITSLRTDVETDGRHATVAYTRDWLVDLERRDFTMNAMSMSFEGELLDPFNGLADLREGVVTFVGDPEKRIKEDYLRILRWFRFRGRFGNQDNQADCDAVQNLCKGLEQISRERVWSEVKQILSRSSGPAQLKDMHDMYIAVHAALPAWIYDITEATQLAAQQAHAITIMVSLYGSKTLPVLLKWKASGDEQALAEFLCKNQDENPFRCMAVQGVSRAWARELALLQNRDAFELAVLDVWDVPVFPVTGYDLIQLGMKPGPDFGDTLARLRDVWADSEYTLSKHRLLESVNLHPQQ
jgi:tRNA nucleotidyltransferase/poly(A) polymerase